MFLRRQSSYWSSRSLSACLINARPSTSTLAATFLTTVDIHRHNSTISSEAKESSQEEVVEAFSSAAQFSGQSGRHYLLKRVLQERGNPPQRVSLATAESGYFILKDIRQSQLNNLRDIYRRLESNKYVRLPEDEVLEPPMFVYRYLADHLLAVVRRELPALLIKRILKDALRGLAAIHDENIVHTDIKANNILVDWVTSKDEISIKQVQLADIEDAVYVPPRSAIVGIQVGNQIWRSPEAHCQGQVNKPSDMFSFGIVCIYAVTRRLLFNIEEGELEKDEEPLALILERQISYFADEEGLEALLKYLGDSPWCQVLEVISSNFNKINPRRPISLWMGIDEEFRDLVIGLTNFDPAKRLTAREALDHRWFKDV